MAEESNPDNMNFDPAKAEGAVDGEVISLEDLDKIIETEDPKFSEEMKKIGADADLKKADLEVLNLEETETEGTEKPVEKKSGLRILMARMAPLFQPFTNLRAKFKAKINTLAADSWHWLKKDFPVLLKKFLVDSKVSAKKTAATLGKWKNKYDKLTGRQKTAIYLAIFGAYGLFKLLSLTLGHGWTPNFHDEIVSTLETDASQVKKIEAKKDLVKFYDAFPQPEHFVLLDKIVVNLKASGEHPLPMMAMEVYVEVDSQETAIEIKDREKQVTDVVQRATEEYPYEDVITNAGKVKLKADIRHDVNEILNQGRVNKVFFQNLILKP